MQGCRKTRMGTMLPCHGDMMACKQTSLAMAWVFLATQLHIMTVKFGDQSQARHRLGGETARQCALERPGQ